MALTEWGESERLSALDRMDLMDTPPEPEFDELVEIAAAICETPMSLVTLLDDRRQWFKAAIGVTVKETPRQIAFCAHAIQQPERMMVVEDATTDPRFKLNPLVTGDMNLRFYAGMPIASPDGFPMGTLCVLDRIPRKLSATQLSALTVLGRQVNARMELRMHRLAMERAVRVAEEAQAKQAASEQRFQTFMDSAPFISFLKDTEGRMVFYNKVVSDKFNVSREEWLGKTDEELFTPEDAARYRASDAEVLQAGSLIVKDERSVTADGTVEHWRSYKFPCHDADGKPLVGGFWVDITEQRRTEVELRKSQRELEIANALLRELAATDALTGLANRRIFDERLTIEFAQAKRKKRALSVLMFDLDHFKKRNDRFGHASGDAALKQFSALLERSVREGDMVARYGGEEFMLLLPETDEAQALLLAERILRATRAEQWPDEPLTASGGVASLNAATPNQEWLLNLADEALYVAKRAGRDQVKAYQLKVETLDGV